MSAAKRDALRVDRLDADMAAVRERLARVEARMEAHDRASETRHREVMGAMEEIGERLEKVEHRSWRLSGALGVLGLGGGAGGIQLLQAFLGG